MTAMPPTTAKSTPLHARPANSFSNSEGVRFGPGEGFMGEFAGEADQLLDAPQPQTRRGRTPNSLADGLLHGFGFVRHGVTLRAVARTVNSLLRENLVEEQINHHAGHGDIHPQRPRPAGDFFVRIRSEEHTSELQSRQ